MFCFRFQLHSSSRWKQVSSKFYLNLKIVQLKYIYWQFIQWCVNNIWPFQKALSINQSVPSHLLLYNQKKYFEQRVVNWTYQTANIWNRLLSNCLSYRMHFISKQIVGLSINLWNRQWDPEYILLYVWYKSQNFNSEVSKNKYTHE